jgi:hypothetical protein
MKCPVCKCLNITEECRKHLNFTTLKTLSRIHRDLGGLVKATEGVVASNCPIHMNTEVLATHLRAIAMLQKDLRALAERAECERVSHETLMKVLNKYRIEK